MAHKTLITMLFAGAACVALPAYAQEDAGRQDVAVQAFGTFVTSTTHKGIDNSATDSSGVRASCRFFFSKHHGVEGSYGYTRNAQKYNSIAGVRTDSHEISGAYIFRMPYEKITPFALAG